MKFGLSNFAAQKGAECARNCKLIALSPFRVYTRINIRYNFHLIVAMTFRCLEYIFEFPRLQKKKKKGRDPIQRRVDLPRDAFSNPKRNFNAISACE